MKNLYIVTRSVFVIVILGSLLINCMAPGENTPPKSHKVVISAMQFQTAEISVAEGDTVVFENRVIVVPDVTEEKSKAGKSSPLANGQSFSLVIKESADYYCSIHPVMKGKIVVNKNR